MRADQPRVWPPRSTTVQVSSSGGEVSSSASGSASATGRAGPSGSAEAKPPSPLRAKPLRDERATSTKLAGGPGAVGPRALRPGPEQLEEVLTARGARGRASRSRRPSGHPRSVGRPDGALLRRGDLPPLVQRSLVGAARLGPQGHRAGITSPFHHPARHGARLRRPWRPLAGPRPEPRSEPQGSLRCGSKGRRHPGRPGPKGRPPTTR